MSADESVVQRVVRQETSRRAGSRQKGAICFEADVGDERRRVRIAQDIDQHFSDAVTSSEPDARDYSDRLPALPLPGSGDLGETCGEDVPIRFCEDCGAPRYVGRTCKNPDCPRCCKAWAFHRATTIASKHESLGRLLYSKGKKAKQHHLTVSFAGLDARFNSEQALDRAFEAVKLLTESTGARTGHIIYHPFRIADEHRGDVLGHSSGDGDMGWADVLGRLWDGEPFEEIAEKYLVFDPHFHVLAVSDWVDCTHTEKIEDRTGVVVHRITTERADGSTASIADLEELCRTTAYSLSHAGIAPASEKSTHRAAVRSFGRVANFQAYDDVVDETKAAMREIAPKVLGCEFPDPSNSCSERVHVEDDDRPAVGGSTIPSGSGAGGGSGSDAVAGPGGSTGSDLPPAARTVLDAVSDDTDAWDDSGGVVPPGVSEPPPEAKERCGGDTVPMRKAPQYLGDLEWVSSIQRRLADGDDRLRGLRRAHEEWRDLGFDDEDDELEPVPSIEDTPPPD